MQRRRIEVARDREAERSRRGSGEPSPALRNYDALILVATLLAAFGAAIAYMGGLDFPLYMDESDYWEQTLEFVAAWPPRAEQLRSYGEPMTPLSFLYWSIVERSFGGGVVGLRISCIALSVATLLLVGWRVRQPRRRALLCAIGLLVYPYWVPLSIVIYTDIPAVFFAVLGLWFYARGRGVASAAAFVLAIATRQYMVTIPAALLAAELAPVALRREAWKPERVLPMAVATGSLLGWVVFFGGLGPSPGLDAYASHVQALLDVTPAYGLYFLSCVGIYFVLPEFLLFRRWREPRPFELSRRNLVLGALLLAAFVVFPPPRDIIMGTLNRGVLALFPYAEFGASSTVIRVALFAALAWFTCVRFRHLDLIFWLLLGRALLMTVSWEGWEKYHVVVLASLWYLRSISDLRGPLDLWRREHGVRAAAAGRGDVAALPPSDLSASMIARGTRSTDDQALPAYGRYGEL